MKCIICRKDTQEKDFSDEHVIPDSIGGVYHIYNVCKICNSYLGRNIDSKLVNHYFTSFMRFKENIKGKSGKIPNPFDGTHKLKNDDETKVKMILDKDGVPIPYLLPKVIKKSSEDKIEIQLHLDSMDRHKQDEMLKKILKREGINENSHKIVTKNEPIINKFEPIIMIEKSLDIKEFKIGLLKIAYEFAVDSIKEYFDDNKAIEISKFLLDPDYNQIDKYFIGSGLEKEVLKPLELLFDLDKKRHLLVLMFVKDYGFICFISLYNLFNIVVKLSEKKYLENNMIIVSNNLENHTFEKLDIFEVYKKISKETIKFGWYFENKQDYFEFFNLENSGMLQYYKIGNTLPFFNKSFKIEYNDIDDLVESYINKNQFKNVGNELYPKYIIELEEILYLKILPLNKYFQVIGLEVENNLEYKY